jgi:hypothetical protein
MATDSDLIDTSLKTPRAAAVAGILFALLAMAGDVLVWSAIPADARMAGGDVIGNAKTLTTALNLTPFAGIAFLWFIAVLRDRLGELEDRFFATVVLGSGLLYIAMYFFSAALAGGLLSAISSQGESLLHSDAYLMARAQMFQAQNVYGIKVAGVFMMSTSTVSLRTRIIPRWLAYLGFVLALFLLLTVSSVQWTPIVFPLWVLLMSVCILVQKLHDPAALGRRSR